LCGGEGGRREREEREGELMGMAEWERRGSGKWE
jgi:hypothetical protein